MVIKLKTSSKTVSFGEFSEIKDFCEALKGSQYKRLVLWKVPSGVVSYLLEKLEGKLIYHLGDHYLLPKAHLSLRVDKKEKLEGFLSLISKGYAV